MTLFDYKVFQQRLISAIRKSGKLQSRVCADTGITISGLQKLLYGFNLHPTADTIVKLASYFGVSCDYLLGVETYGVEDRQIIIYLNHPRNKHIKEALAWLSTQTQGGKNDRKRV